MWGGPRRFQSPLSQEIIDRHSVRYVSVFHRTVILCLRISDRFVFVLLTDSVGKLKGMIEDATRVPSHEQRLLFGGKQLKDDLTLTDYKIQSDSNMQLALRLRAGSAAAAGSTQPTNGGRVLVVGAGPTGMIMTCQLAMHKVPVKLIDRLAEPATNSRAFTIHARTLELLGQMGLAEKFLAKGIKTNSMEYHFPGKEETPNLDFRSLDSQFPFCLTINQAETEAILREHVSEMGIEIAWNTELVSLEDMKNGRVTATLKMQEDHEAKNEFEYIIGCDGVYSTVRRQMKVRVESTFAACSK